MKNVKILFVVGLAIVTVAVVLYRQATRLDRGECKAAFLQSLEWVKREAGPLSTQSTYLDFARSSKVRFSLTEPEERVNGVKQINSDSLTALFFPKNQQLDLLLVKVNSIRRFGTKWRLDLDAIRSLDSGKGFLVEIEREDGKFLVKKIEVLWVR